MVAWIVGGIAATLLGVALLYRPVRRLAREVREERAHELFQLQREMLEAKFLELARSAQGAAGPRWSDCEFDGDARFARHAKSGQLVAFVEITVHFEPGDSAGESDVVGPNRQATAVFHYHHGQWGTGGRTLFDMTPGEAIEHFSGEYRPIPFSDPAE